MRAAHIVKRGDPQEAIELVNIDRPDPGPSEVLIRVEACAMNYKDVFARTGHPDREDDFPKQMGSDVAGVIDEIGTNVNGWKVGDRVNVYSHVSCGKCEYCLQGETTMCKNDRSLGSGIPGGFAEYITIPADNLEPIPDSIDFVTAAAWPVTFTTAWRMIVTAGQLRPAESALILGASGGVGNAALQIATRLGATTYTTTSTPNKAEKAGRWAEEVIDYTETNFAERIQEITDNRGVDLVADHVGEVTWQKSVNSLAKNGRMVICGATSGAHPDIDIRSVYQHHRQIIGAPMGNRQDFRAVGQLINHGELKPQIDRVLPLDQITEGHQALENRDVFGKIVIQPGA